MVQGFIIKMNDIILEKENFLYWYSTATVEDIETALEEHKETAERLMEKYKAQIDLIKITREESKEQFSIK